MREDDKNKQPHERLRSLRLHNGLTMRDVEEMTDGAVSYSYIGRLETGKADVNSLTMKSSRAIGEVYGMDLQTFMYYLFGWGEVGVKQTQKDAQTAETRRRVKKLETLVGQLTQGLSEAQDELEALRHEVNT